MSFCITQFWRWIFRYVLHSSIKLRDVVFESECSTNTTAHDSDYCLQEIDVNELLFVDRHLR